MEEKALSEKNKTSKDAAHNASKAATATKAPEQEKVEVKVVSYTEKNSNKTKNITLNQTEIDIKAR